MDEVRRSGLDRRSKQDPTPDDRRSGKDRRAIFDDLYHTIQRYKAIPLFEGLTIEQLTKMLRICSKKKYLNQKYIYRLGEESSTMFILLKGKLSIRLKSGVEWQSISPPRVVGEMGIFTGDRRSASVIAETDCIVLSFNKVELLNVFRSDIDLCNKIQLNIIKELSKKMRNDNEQIEELLQKIHSLEMI
ncbi:MAG: cyclic nucleotide-binding domain-containing protein [Candidatus Latescibacteria bacterium]|nr:cyclic nucleotide-binding domain-containing protein [Candidatus Latescibacterota bacterium]